MSAGPAPAPARAAVTAPPTPAQQLFRDVFARHAAGVTVITLRDAESGAPVGFTATSVISVSVAPPTLAFSITRTSSSWPALSRARSLVVNFLPAGASALSSRFATHGIDRFAGVAHRTLDGGEPVLQEADSWLRARIQARHITADSALVVAQIQDGSAGQGEPLVYLDRAYHGLRSLPAAGGAR